MYVKPHVDVFLCFNCNHFTPRLEILRNFNSVKSYKIVEWDPGLCKGKRKRERFQERLRQVGVSSIPTVRRREERTGNMMSTTKKKLCHCAKEVELRPPLLDPCGLPWGANPLLYSLWCLTRDIISCKDVMVDMMIMKIVAMIIIVMMMIIVMNWWYWWLH